MLLRILVVSGMMLCRLLVLPSILDGCDIFVFKVQGVQDSSLTPGTSRITTLGFCGALGNTMI